MVSKQKELLLKEVSGQMGEYPVVGILDMHKLPARQLHEIRNRLRGKVVIRMVKKRLIGRALKQRGLEKLEPFVQGEPALFLTKESPFKIARVLEASKSEAAAKPGDIAPRDIWVRAGATSLAPGPVIGEFQRAKIPAGVEGEKIVIKKDALVVKQGEVVSEAVAGILSKLNIKPMEIGLNLVAAWEGGQVYGKDLLFVSLQEYEERVRTAARHAFSLAIQARIFTAQTVPFLLGKAEREAKALALKAGVISPGTIGALLAQGKAQAEGLGKRLNI